MFGRYTQGITRNYNWITDSKLENWVEEREKKKTYMKFSLYVCAHQMIGLCNQAHSCSEFFFLVHYDTDRCDIIYWSLHRIWHTTAESKYEEYHWFGTLHTQYLLLAHESLWLLVLTLSLSSRFIFFFLLFVLPSDSDYLKEHGMNEKKNRFMFFRNLFFLFFSEFMCFRWFFFCFVDS